MPADRRSVKYIFALVLSAGALVFTGSLAAHPPDTDPRPDLSNPPCQVWAHKIKLCWPKLEDVVRYNFYFDQVLIGFSTHGGLVAKIFSTPDTGSHPYSVEAIYSDGHGGRDTVVFSR